MFNHLAVNFMPHFLTNLIWNILLFMPLFEAVLIPSSDMKSHSALLTGKVRRTSDSLPLAVTAVLEGRLSSAIEHFLRNMNTIHPSRDFYNRRPPPFLHFRREFLENASNNFLQEILVAQLILFLSERVKQDASVVERNIYHVEPNLLVPFIAFPDRFERFHGPIKVVDCS